MRSAQGRWRSPTDGALREAGRRLPGMWLCLALALAPGGRAGGDAGYWIDAGRIVVDRASQWQAWQHPRHAVWIDPERDTVGPRYLRKGVDVVPELPRFRTKIGDDRDLERFLDQLRWQQLPVPRNITSGPATVAGVPLVHARAAPSKGIEVGDPVEWYFLQGGIRLAPRNAETAANVLDGDPQTYWEPTTVVTRQEYEALLASERGLVYRIVGDERVSRDQYDAAAPAERRQEYHNRSLDEWYLEVDLGKVMPVSRVVLHFVAAEAGEPFEAFRILGSSSHRQEAPLHVLAVHRVEPGDGRTVSVDFGAKAEGRHEQLQLLRIAVTSSRLDRFRKISEREYRSLPLAERGAIDYYVHTALGGEAQVDEDAFARAGSERQSRRVFHQRERPRLAGLEVWVEGDNLGLEFLEGGGSATMAGVDWPLEAGFDGKQETSYRQYQVPRNTSTLAGSRGDLSELGLLNVDLGAVFWVDQVRTLGCCGGGRFHLEVGDGSRAASGQLRWQELAGGSDLTAFVEANDFELRLDRAMRVRYLRSQLFFDDSPWKVGGWQVSEFQLFGDGYAADVALESPTIELPPATTLGVVAWEGETPESTAVVVRTRTGDRLVERTTYYTSAGAPVTAQTHGSLSSRLQGPVLTDRVPGSGWSPWSSPYRPGERVTSPSPRRYLQVQVRLTSVSPHRGARVRQLGIGLQPAIVRQAVGELWPDHGIAGRAQRFEVYVSSRYDETASGAGGFDEVWIDPGSLQQVEIVDVAIGSEAELAAGTASVTEGTSHELDGSFVVRLPHRVGAGAGDGGSKIFHRIAGEDDEVPVDEDGRVLKELTYLALPELEQGRILYFEDPGDGTAPSSSDTLSRFDYGRLPPERQGSVRYLRRVSGGEFPFDRLGNPLSAAQYLALPETERGAVLAEGERVRVRLSGIPVLHGTTVNVSLRDTRSGQALQPVDPGDATAATPSRTLTLTMPLGDAILQDVRVAPNPFTPNGDGINDTVQVEIVLAKLNRDRRIEVAVFDLSGRAVWRRAWTGLGIQRVAWDGRDGAARRVRPGLYVLRVAVEPDAERARGVVVSRALAVVY